MSNYFDRQADTFQSCKFGRNRPNRHCKYLCWLNKQYRETGFWHAQCSRSGESREKNLTFSMLNIWSTEGQVCHLLDGWHVGRSVMYPTKSVLNARGTEVSISHTRYYAVNEVSHTHCLIWDYWAGIPHLVLYMGLLTEVCHTRCSISDTPSEVYKTRRSILDVMNEASHTHCSIWDLLREMYSCDRTFFNRNNLNPVLE